MNTKCLLQYHFGFPEDIYALSRNMEISGKNHTSSPIFEVERLIFFPVDLSSSLFHKSYGSNYSQTLKKCEQIYKKWRSVAMCICLDSGLSDIKVICLISSEVKTFLVLCFFFVENTRTNN